MRAYQDSDDGGLDMDKMILSVIAKDVLGPNNLICFAQWREKREKWKKSIRQRKQREQREEFERDRNIKDEIAQRRSDEVDYNVQGAIALHLRKGILGDILNVLVAGTSREGAQGIRYSPAAVSEYDDPLSGI